MAGFRFKGEWRQGWVRGMGDMIGSKGKWRHGPGQV